MLLKIAVAGTLLVFLGSGSSLAITQQTQTEGILADSQREVKSREVDRASRNTVRISIAPKKAQVPSVKKKISKPRPKVKKKTSSLRIKSTAPQTGVNRRIGRSMAAARGWTGDQWICLNNLWTKESGWRTKGGTPARAYGIPQSLPGRKMASAGADWRTNPRTQIKWGLGYIKGRYGSPCSAWRHSQSHNWY
jgi:resuscitation-promoting factor RpfB